MAPANNRPIPNPLELDAQLCFALHSASHAMTRLYRALLDELGVTYPQYLVLLVLWQHGTARVSDIGERLFLDSATLTPLLKRLEAMGLVTRTRDTADERVVLVALTADGTALRARAQRLPAAVGRASCLTAAEMDDLRVSLVSLRSQLLHLESSDLSTLYPSS